MCYTFFFLNSFYLHSNQVVFFFFISYFWLKRSRDCTSVVEKLHGGFCSVQFCIETLSLSVKLSVKPNMTRLLTPPGSALSAQTDSSSPQTRSGAKQTSRIAQCKILWGDFGWGFLPPEMGWWKSSGQIYLIWSQWSVSFCPVWMFIINLWEMRENMQREAASKQDLTLFFRGAVTPSPSAFFGQKYIPGVELCSIIYGSIYCCYSGTFSPPSTKLNAHLCTFPPAWRSIFGVAAAHNGMPTVGEVFAECSNVLHIHQTPLAAEGGALKASPQISHLTMALISSCLWCWLCFLWKTLDTVSPH